MTKKQELTKWEAFASSIPKDSYTYGWITNQLPFLKTCMETDVFPEIHSLTLEEYLKRVIASAKIMEEDAKAEAESIIAKAKAEAARIEAQRTSAYDDAHVALRSAIQQLELVAERL